MKLARGDTVRNITREEVENTSNLKEVDGELVWSEQHLERGAMHIIIKVQDF